jgi:hypothetical protein
MISGDRGFELTKERVFCMKVSRLDVGWVIFPDFDGQRISVNQIPGIAAEFALDILNKTRWTIYTEVFTTAQGNTNEAVKSDEVIHVRMRDENILCP